MPIKDYVKEYKQAAKRRLTIVLIMDRIKGHTIRWFFKFTDEELEEYLVRLVLLQTERSHT